MSFTKFYDIDDLSVGKQIISNYELFLNACKFFPMMSQAKIAPDFYNFSLKKKENDLEGVIIVKRYLNSTEQIYKDIVSENRELFIEKVHKKIRKISAMDVCHADLDLINIVIQEDPFDVFFIDWDFSFNVSTIGSKIIDFYEFDRSRS